MRVGRGVKKELGTERPSLLADAFEAVVAALYFERGYDAAKEFVHETLARDVTEAALAPSDVDPKTRLRQWAESRDWEARSTTSSSDGPAHSTTYVATVRVGDLVAVGEGRSKKSAEGQAARSAWREHDCLSSPKWRPFGPRSRATSWARSSSRLGDQRASGASPQDGQGLSRHARGPQRAQRRAPRQEPGVRPRQRDATSSFT